MVYKQLLDGTWICVPICDYLEIYSYENKNQLTSLYDNGEIIIAGNEEEEIETDCLSTCLPTIYSPEYQCQLDHLSQPKQFSSDNGEYRMEL